MSDLDNLIAEYCPDGVEFRTLLDLVSYEQPGKYLVSSTAYSDEFATPVLTAGKTPVLGYTDEPFGIYPASADNPVVIFDDFTTAFKWVDFPFKVKSSAMKLLTLKPGVDRTTLRFVWYAMQAIKYKPQDHARQWIGTYSRFKIPLPPMPIQHAVVAVLDRLGRLGAQLETELEAELDCRSRQYAFYREELLTFREAPDVRWAALGEVGEFIRGRRFTKKDVTDEGIASIHYGEIYTGYGTFASRPLSTVRPDLRPALRFAKPRDLVIAGVGETVEDVGKAVAWLGDEEVAIHDDCFAFRHDMDPKFVSYYFQTETFHAEKAKHVARAKVKRLSGESLAKLKIPRPPLTEQERVVAILDKFYHLVNELSIGLPAERAARQKQFTYYRDKLLTFEERVA